MTDFPEGTPKFVQDAVNSLDDKRRSMAFEKDCSSETWRGYFMAIQDLINELEGQAALERGQAEEARAEALKRYAETHGESAS